MTDDLVNPDWTDAVTQAMHNSSVNREVEPESESEPEPDDRDTRGAQGRHVTPDSSPPSSPRDRRSRPPFNITFPKPPTVNLQSPSRDTDHSISDTDDVESMSSNSNSKSRTRSHARAQRFDNRRERNHGDEEQEKYELLSRIQHMISEKGYTSYRQVGPSDSIHDVRYEFFRAQREVSKRTSVKLMQKYLITFTSIIEMAADYYNPLNLKLAGYSKSVLLSMKDYEPILEELHYKYSDTVSMSPELKLIMALGSSAFFYHTGNNFRASSPQASTHDDFSFPIPSSSSTSGSQPSMKGPRSRNAASAPDLAFNPLSVMMGMGMPGMMGAGAGGGAINPADLMNGLSMVQSLMAKSA